MVPKGCVEGVLSSNQKSDNLDKYFAKFCPTGLHETAT